MSTNLEFLNSLDIGNPNPQLHLDISDGCNIKCTMCTFHDKNNKKTWLEATKFKKIKEAIAPFNFVQIGQGSEPFINPQWFDIVKFITKKKINVQIQTNCKAIQHKEFAEKIVRSGLLILAISIDGISDESITKNRIGISAKELFRAIQLINYAKKKLNSKTPILISNSVAMRSNLEELPSLAQFLINNGFKKLRIGFLELRQPHPRLVSELLIYEKLRARKTISHIKNIINKHDKPVFLDTRLFNVANSSKKKDQCSVYNDFFYSNLDGNLTTCYGKCYIGNIFKKNTADHLTSDSYYSFVEKIKKKPNEICSKCRYCNTMSIDDIKSHFSAAAIEFYSIDTIQKSLDAVSAGSTPEQFWKSFYA